MGIKNIKLIVSACTVNLLAFAIGNVYAWSSTALVTLKSPDPEVNPLGRPVTVLEESWIASLVSLGASCGPLLSGFLAGKLGRKVTLLAFSFPMLVAQIILAFASTPAVFYVARFMSGLGVGCGYTVIPMYIGEISETRIRGVLGCILSLFNALGFLYVIAIGPFVSIKILSILLMLPVLCFLIFFGCFVPESPHYYISKGQYNEAEESLKKLRSKDNSNLKELEDMKETVERYGGKKTSFLKSLKSRSFRKGIIITTTLMIFQQFVGITFIQSYMELIFIASGSTMSSSGSAVIIGVIQVLGVLVSASLVDRWGRRMLLILSSFFCAVPLFTLGLFFYLKNIQDVNHLWWLPVSSLGVYIIGYCSGICTLPWALVGELFSSETKSLAATFSAIVNLFLAFVVMLAVPIFKEMVGFEGVFWFFSASSLVCALFVLCYVPETKGKTFQEILTMLGEK
ncbi:facilitated trehalose transporter Tret1-like [Harmonia axyridis]|uniref:facilitated trehalose transporter Tret1-like n=1 Tax=Harmonia axyridis TaxID=115357 RepID=UPI001E27556D|nr:facilitated trehalose transporter Tret1-like [Harmonia axyridis]